MEKHSYKRIDFESNEFKDVLSFYDLFIEYYNTLSEIEKNNFDLGLTLVVNTEYFRRHSRSSINRDLEIIPEILKFIYPLTVIADTINIEENISYEKLSKTISDNSNNNLKFTGNEINSHEETLTQNLFYIFNDFTTWLISRKEINNNLNHSKYREINNTQSRANSKIKIASHNIIKQYKLINFKSKYSPTSNPLRTIIRNMIIEDYINRSQKKLLIKAFTGFDIDKKERLIWKKGFDELRYFLRKLHNTNYIEYEHFKEVCIIASLIFINKKELPIHYNQIFKSRPPNEKARASIDNIFK